MVRLPILPTDSLEADSSWDCEFCKFVMNEIGTLKLWTLFFFFFCFLLNLEIGHVVSYKESQQEFLKVVDLACDSASDAYTQKTVN